MAKKILQIKIILKESKPPIWRRFQVSQDTLLPDLHKIIQTVMGWTNSHLHQFEDGRTYYALPSEDDCTPVIDYSNLVIGKFLKKEGDTLVYEYDFGDGWEHLLKLENVLDSGSKVPVCLAGKRACPPEDCGGVWGYSDLLEILADLDHEEHESFMEWVGDDFDPDYFYINEVNELLKEDDFGCITIWDDED